MTRLLSRQSKRLGVVMLRLVDIEKSYRLGTLSVEVLRGVNLEVAEGDLLSIMGASGSGKSTLLNIIGLLGKPTDGILLHKRPRCPVDERPYAFVLPQRQHRFRVPVVQSTGSPYGAGERGGASRVPGARPGVDPAPGSDDAGARWEWEIRLGHRPDQLSGGQKQRVAIARALVGEPSVVLADEPTGALDADTANEVIDLLIQLNVEERITILIITHDAAIARRCTRQATIGDGLLCERAGLQRGQVR